MATFKKSRGSCSSSFFQKFFQAVETKQTRYTKKTTLQNWNTKSASTELIDQVSRRRKRSDNVDGKPGSEATEIFPSLNEIVAAPKSRTTNSIAHFRAAISELARRRQKLVLRRPGAPPPGKDVPQSDRAMLPSTSAQSLRQRGHARHDFARVRFRANGFHI